MGFSICDCWSFRCVWHIQLQKKIKQASSFEDNSEQHSYKDPGVGDYISRLTDARDFWVFPKGASLFYCLRKLNFPGQPRYIFLSTLQPKVALNSGEMGFVQAYAAWKLGLNPMRLFLQTSPMGKSCAVPRCHNPQGAEPPPCQTVAVRSSSWSQHWAQPDETLQHSIGPESLKITHTHIYRITSLKEVVHDR